MRLAFLIIVLIATQITTLGGSAFADVIGVRAAGRADGARLVVDLAKETAYRAFALSNPARIVIDLPTTRWRAGGLPPGDGAVASLRHGRFRPDIYRLVFDLKREAAIVDASMIAGTDGAGRRLVVDLAYGRAATNDRFGSLDPAPHEATPAPTPAPRERVIVIDAGHGGIDPGARGVGGVIEKDINLEVARSVKRILDARPGYRVVLTRDSDIFLRLRERVRRGRAAKADLFISIHADSHPNDEVNGASLYTLSEQASDREAARLAQSENRADLIGGVPVEGGPSEVFDILIDLAQRDTQNRSSAVADDLLFALASTQPLLRRPKRSAGFAVLKAPDVPSVLIELGFISNRADASRLATREGRDHIAAAISAGVVRYFDGANTARVLEGR